MSALSNKMDIYDELVNKIVATQQDVIGPVAVLMAKKVKGLDFSNKLIHVTAEPKVVLSDLVLEYSKIFGDASIEMCKESIRNIDLNLQKPDLPDILK